MTLERNKAIQRLHQAAFSARGWVYVMSNPSMPALVKVGYSMKDPMLRAEELNHTGVPRPYVIECDLLVTGPRRIEQLAHAALQEFSEGKEWFRTDPVFAYDTILRTISENPSHQILLCSPPPLVAERETKKAEQESINDFWNRHMPS